MQSKLCGAELQGTGLLLSVESTVTVQIIPEHRMAQCGKDASKKEMKAEKKAYDKSLKKIIGKKNFRILKGCDKVVCKAVALNEKIAEKPARPAKEKKSKK